MGMWAGRYRGRVTSPAPLCDGTVKDSGALAGPRPRLPRLDRQEVLDHDPDLAAYDLLGDPRLGDLLTEPLAPDRHLPGAVGLDLEAAGDQAGDLSPRKGAATPDGDAREVGGRRAQRSRDRPVAAPALPVAGGAAAHEDLLPELGHHRIRRGRRGGRRGR